MSTHTDNPRKALGRGLNALISTRTAPKADDLPPQPAQKPENVSRIPIHLIEPNPLQPRTVFNPERLQELADSIRANGIIQPLVVRPAGERYQLVAGERRWRAAKIAGLQDVPVVVQAVPDDRLLEITLIENIQREDLNVIEVAHAFDKLCHELNLSHDDVAQRTGKNRSTITNTLRLLKLPADIQELLAEHRLSMGHARAILGLPTPELQRQVAEKASAQGLSVRQVEHIVQKMTAPREPQPVEEGTDPNVKAAIDAMERALGTRVRISGVPNHRGRVEIEFYSPDDLDRIYSIIVGERS